MAGGGTQPPGAYKDVDLVMEQSRDLVETVHTFRQIVNVKGDQPRGEGQKIGNGHHRNGDPRCAEGLARRAVLRVRWMRCAARRCCY